MSIRSWDSRNDYRFDTLSFDTLLFDRGFACVAVTDVGSPIVSDVLRSDGQPIGLEARFDVSGGGDDLVVTIRIVAKGETFEDSAVELTTTVQNVGGAERRLGVQYVWNIGMVGTGGAALGPVPPDPPRELWSSREGEWLDPDFDHLLASWTNAPSLFEPYYFGGIAVNGPWTLDPAPTPPDVIVRSGDWTGLPPGGLGNTCFAWEAPDPPRGGPIVSPGGSGIEGLAYYWGRTEDSAIHLAPGESRSFTTWFWAFRDNPVSCSLDGPSVVECAGPATPVLLDGSGSATVDGNDLLYRWSSADAGVTFDDASAARPTAYLPGIGTYPIKLEVGIGPFTKACQSEIDVVDTTPPSFRTLSVQPALLWPPNHRLIDVHVDAAVEDECDAAPVVRLISATSSEPDDAIGLGDGHTVDDIQGADIGQDDHDILLRAERDGDGVGRTYTLTYEARDDAGNVATSNVDVRVPHDLCDRSARPLLARPRPPRP